MGIGPLPPDNQTEDRTGSLSPRQRDILRMIVHEYVSSGRPVGSKVLVERFGLPISSATIRHEMAELEEQGLVQSLHTSGGRVPTDRGYRFYVHHLMGTVELPAGDQIMIRHQFQQTADHLEGWMELAASVLATTAGNVSVVTAPRSVVPRLRHFELIQIQPRLALMVLVTFESVVRQAMVHLAEDVSQEDLSRLADGLVLDLTGLSALEIEGRLFGLDGPARVVTGHLVVVLHQLELAGETAIRHSGLENIVGLPDLGQAEVQHIVTLLNTGGLLTALLPRLTSEQEVQVFIGGDQLPVELRSFGVVLSTYGVDDVMTGVLGVLGPTRMSYWRTISTVRYMARLMSDLMSGVSPRVD